ncbi:MAG: 5'-nucleotidase C-terminal domain-containing protein [Rikenellaceae bacterium]
MKKLYKATSLLALSAIVLSTALLAGCSTTHSREFVILTTNDMHAQIDKFPALATAIEQCRDTANVILVDAGDRWTGNAFVDLVDNYTPIYELMNNLNYDVAIFGNHEFDKGQAYLAASNRQATFPIIGANIISDTTSFPQPAPHIIIEVEDKKIAFVGITGNYNANGYPAGKDESYAGLTFTDPHSAASQYSYLADQCDMLVLVSHSGLERDVEFAQSPLSQGFDQIISSHSHDTANQEVNGILVTQTGSRLKNIGATKVTITKDGAVKLSHRNIPLSTYSQEAHTAKLVEGYYNNPELNAPIGKASGDFSSEGLRNLFAETIRKRTSANIGLYHSGGVRIESLKEGDVSLADILNAEPFGSYIATCTMTQDQLREMIMTKFNDKVNVGEAHYIDIVTTTPYEVITDQSGDAIDIIFPNLDPKRNYKVAMGDYIYKTYSGLNHTNGQVTDILITDTFVELLKGTKPIAPDNNSYQKIVKESERAEQE